MDNAALVDIVHGPGQHLDQHGRRPAQLRHAVQPLSPPSAIYVFQAEEG